MGEPTKQNMTVQELINQIQRVRPDNSQAEVLFIAQGQVALDSINSEFQEPFQLAFKEVNITSQHPNQVKIWLS